MSEKKIDSKLSRRTKEAVEVFQRYAVDQYRNASGRWPLCRSLMQNIAKEFLRQLELHTLVVDPGFAAELLNVHLSFDNSRTNNLCGGLTPVRLGFNAIIFGDPDGARARFTVAHECGHAFFYFLGSSSPERIIPMRSSSDPRLARRQEGLCDVFAGELLLPEDSIREFAQQNVSLKAVLAEARQRRVSSESLVRRVLYDMHCWESAVFYLIRKGDGQPNISSYRGMSRKKDYSTAPSSNTIAKALNGIAGVEVPSVAEALLRNSYGIAKPEVCISDHAIWIRV